MQKKKLQVFVSSTYEDLKEERQAAVEAILSAGHIPAGMELFTAGDESQWKTIQTWIEESDVYMLILGGRYGSIEPKSGKSYTRLEYEYALEKEKPLFSVVGGSQFAAQHKDNRDLSEFKALVTSKMVRFWEDKKDIKLAVHETLGEFSKRENLVGWIPGNQGFNSPEVAEELAKLSKENAELREKVAEFEQGSFLKIYGLSFPEFMEFLVDEHIRVDIKDEAEYRKIAQMFGHEDLNLVHYLWKWADKFDGVSGVLGNKATNALSKFGIINWVEDGHKAKFTDVGRSFYLSLKAQIASRSKLEKQRIDARYPPPPRYI